LSGLPWTHPAWSAGAPSRTAARFVLIGLGALCVGRFVNFEPARGEGRYETMIVGIARSVILAALLLGIALPTALCPTSILLPATVFAGVVFAADRMIRSVNVSLLAVGTVAAVVCAEIMLRALGAAGVVGTRIQPPLSREQVNWHQPDRSFVWTGLSGLPTGEFHTVGRWNRWGFNDREPRPARPGETSIVVVGDSYVEALQVPRERSFWRVAESALASSGTLTHWVGLGASGNGAVGGAELVEQYAPEIRPGVLVYAFCSNDVRDDYAPWRRAQDRWATPPHPWLAPGNSGSLLVEFARFRVWRALLHFKAADPYPVPPEYLTFSTDDTFDVRTAFDAFFVGLNRMRAFSARVKADFVVLELPSGTDGYENELCRELAAKDIPCDVNGPGSRLRAAATADGFTLVSPKEQMQMEARRGQRLVYRWDGHYTEEGHACVGRVLATAVADLLAARRASRE
jgi:hypothetical protein